MEIASKCEWGSYWIHNHRTKKVISTEKIRENLNDIFHIPMSCMEYLFKDVRKTTPSKNQVHAQKPTQFVTAQLIRIYVKFS